jgi:hypothetical protein
VRLIAIPAIFAIGALFGHLALQAAPPGLAFDRAQPLIVATTWGWYGALCTAVLLVSLAIAMFFYLRAMRATDPPPMRSILMAIGASLAAGMFWTPLFSSDVYAYAAYGEMARLGLDPYIPQTIPANNALLTAALWQWQPAIPPCVYGEAFVQLSRSILAATHALPLTLTLNAFRLISGAAFLYCVAAIGRLGSDELAGRRAALALGCNPVALWAAIEGHNDTLMLAIVLGGILLSMHYARFGVLLATLGALIKAPALLAGAALAIQDVAATRSIKALTGFLVGCALVAAISQRLIASVRDNLAPHGHYAPLASVQALGLAPAVVVVAFVVWRVGAFKASIDRWCVAALALWALIPNPYPWYALWVLPIAALATDSRVRYAAIAITSAALLRYIPDSVGTPAAAFSFALGALATVAYLPLFRRTA